MFLPVNRKEMEDRGWDRPDFVYVSGDAYVDHSSFGPAIISRVLESHGYKVAMLPQPEWHDEKAFMEFGEPRLGFLVSAGNMDSMVNHYTVNKKPRSTDAYSPGGKRGMRPDNATIVYCNMIKKAYKNAPVIIGGIEASLRRLAHYDYWANKFRRSILMDSGADLLSYGMGELSIVEIADALDSGLDIKDITFIAGTCYKSRETEQVYDGIELPDYEVMKADKTEYARSFGIQARNTDSINGRPLIEKYGEKRYVIQNPPMRPLTMDELDDVHALPYENAWHPMYDAEGGIPAFGDIKFSLTSNRGCYGGCSFCSLNFHQGRIVQARSHESLIREAEEMIRQPDFKGYIYDVGGPSANFRGPACKKQMEKGVCQNKQCLYPTVCKNIKADHTDYLELLRKLRHLPGVKKVFIRSGIRYDYVMADKDDTFLKELCQYHISGQLRVAPEHVSQHVLDLMGKPSRAVYDEFCKRYKRIDDRYGSRQYLVPYLISSHPGSTLDDAIALAEAIRDMGFQPDQVQDFYPTPSTAATVMYYAGLDPRTMEPVVSVTNPKEKAMQRALLQYRRPENYDLVKQALIKAGREDLIGFGKECLIPPRPMGSGGHRKGGASAKSGNRSGSRPNSASGNRRPKRSGSESGRGAKSGRGRRG